MLGGGDDDGTYCDSAIETLKQQMFVLAKKHLSIEDVEDDVLKNHIEDWFDGTPNDDTPLKKLLNPINEDSKPLWWAGFNLSDPKIKDQFRIFIINKKYYTDCNTIISELTDNPSYQNLRSSCPGVQKLENFETFVSKFFTIIALNKASKNNKNNTLTLNLLLNKDVNKGKRPLIDSYFYKVELEIISDFCIENNKKCNIYIHNLRDNCGDIKKELIDRAYLLCVDSSQKRGKDIYITKDNIIKFICFKDIETGIETGIETETKEIKI